MMVDRSLQVQIGRFENIQGFSCEFECIITLEIQHLLNGRSLLWK